MTAPPILVVGPGRVGSSLAAALSASGRFRRVSLHGRGPGPPSLPGAVGLAYRHGAPDLSPLYEEGVSSDRSGEGERGDPSVRPLLLFCVPDAALESAAGAWGEALARRRPAPPPVALHTSGHHPPGALAPLAEAGASVGVFHPLVAVPAPSPDVFEGVTVGMAGEDAALEAGRELLAALGARGIVVERGESARYHAAAVFASNFLVACLAAATEELSESSGGEGGLDDLLPLARSAIEGVASRGLVEGATGPVERGDVGTVERHLGALAPERRELYRGLARELLDLLGDGIDPEARRRLEVLLATPGEER